MKRARPGIPALAAVAAWSLGAGPVSAQVATPPRADATPAWVHVTYISGPTIYLGAGSRAGLSQGTHLTVLRDTMFVAELSVQYISSSSAAATVSRASTLTVAVGDSAVFSRPAAPASDAPAITAQDRTPVPAAGRPSNLLRGRIGVRYLMVDAGIGPAGVMTQPAFDLRLEGTHVGDSPVGVAVDVRAQRSIVAPPDSLHPAASYPLNVTRVYKAALQWNPPGSPVMLTVGRQVSATSPSVGLFDGAAFDYMRTHWSAGAFAGLQPSWYTFAFSDSTREYGAYVQWHNAAARMPVWSFTVGGVGAYTMGQIDREFAYAAAMVTGSRFAAYVTQELDINRGWRAAQERSAATPTSTFATAQFWLTDALSLSGGLDNRRNVRLYRDYLNPETAFDDSFREGVWGGATLNVQGRLRMSGEVRRTSGGLAGTAQSYTGSTGVMRLTPLELGIQVRDTHYAGQLLTGDLRSASADANPFDLVHLDATVGLRTSTALAPAAGIGSSRATWTEFGADWAVGRSVYMMFSIYRELGAGVHSAQTFLSISYRF